MKRDGRKRVELEKKIEEMTSEMENHRLSIDDHNKVFYEMKKRKDQLQTERSALWRNETLVQQNLASSKEELAKSDQVFILIWTLKPGPCPYSNNQELILTEWCIR